MRQGTLRCLAVAHAVLLLGTAGLRPDARADGPAPLRALPDDRLGVRTAPLLLLSRADVRADLDLSAEQAAAADAAVADLHARAARLRGKSGEEALAGRKAVDDAQKAWIDAHLTPAQRDRLVQIDLQWEGSTALVSRPIVRDTLGLTSVQQAEIRQAIAHRDAARPAASPIGRRAAEAELARQALAVLDEAQRERWKAMLGRPFTPRLAAVEQEPPATTGAGQP